MGFFGVFVVVVVVVYFVVVVAAVYFVVVVAAVVVVVVVLFFRCPIICADTPLVPAFLPPATSKTDSASRPCRQRSTGRDVRSLVGCHLKETLHCCRVTSVVFSGAGSDSTYAGHHLLCPLLTTMLAKSRSQSEWASPPEIRPPLCFSLNWFSYVDSLTLKALIKTASGKEGGMNTDWVRSRRQHCMTRATEAETMLFIKQRWMRMITNRGPFCFEATWQHTRLTVKSILMLTRPGTFVVGQVLN